MMCTCCVFALQVLGFFVYNFVTNFILEPTYQTCFTNTLQKLKQDPRITVRLGNDIVGEWQHTSLLQGRLSSKSPTQQHCQTHSALVTLGSHRPAGFQVCCHHHFVFLLLQGMGRSQAAGCRGSKSRIKYTRTTTVWSMYE